MKLRAVFGLVLLLLGASLGWAESRPAAGPVKAGTPKAAPGKKAEPPPKIDGVVINRSTGGFLGFRFVGNNIVLTFHDAEKKKTAVDVARGNVRWKMKFRPGDDRAVLMPGPDGQSLTSEKIIPPPHTLKFFLSLYREGGSEPVESYVVDYRE